MPPVLIPPETIRAVARELQRREQCDGRMKASKTRARFMVLAASGVRPSELMRAQPADIDLERRTWRVRTGKGGFRPGGLYLHDDLLAAWRVFIAAGAWGYFQQASWVETIRHAGWPEGVRPYHLRASVGIELSEAGTDLADVSALLGHTKVQTTRSHYVPVLSSRLKLAAERIGGRIEWDRAD